MKFFILHFICSFLSVSVIADFVLFEPGLIQNTTNANLTTGCINALQATIKCDPYLKTSVMVNSWGYLPVSTLDTICSTTCSQSVAAYYNNVAASCAKDPYPWPGESATLYPGAIWNQFNMTCFKDTAGQYCQNYFANLTTPSGDTAMTSLPKSVLCSSCVLKLGQLHQGSPYGNYGPKMADSWASIQTLCGVSYPTAIPSAYGNRTDVPGFAPTGYAVPSCASGKYYTVVSGDTCGGIAAKQSVPRGTLQAINNVLPTCTDLYVGQKLCLPVTCTIYTVKSGDSCIRIANSASITLTQFLAWNPFLNPACTNLIAGDGVCVNQPGTAWTGTTIAGATVTKTVAYATATVTPPGAVASGTTKKCGKYYKVQSGDNCSLISQNNTITVDLFMKINPSINSGCTNLQVDLYYCVLPTADWNATITSTTSVCSATPPAATVSGTTNQCCQYYTVQSGDYCAKITAAYGITMAQLMQWNTNLKSDCSNLQLGVAYCVQGPAAATTSSTSKVAKRTVDDSARNYGRAEVTPHPHAHAHAHVHRDSHGHGH